MARCRRGRWADQLWHQKRGWVPPNWNPRRSDSQGREAGRSTGTAADQIRAGHQHEDRRGARPHRPAGRARHRRRGDGVKRRAFISLLGGAAAWPLAVRAQQPTMPSIGFVRITTPQDSAHLVAAFRRGLADIGYVEGQNVTIEYRYALNQVERLPAIMADLVGRRVSVLAATGGTISARAAKAATATIPIVFTTGDDPVRVGLVASLSRPDGNATGVSVFTARLGSKRLGLLHEMVPMASPIGVLVNPTNPDTEDEANDIREAARGLGVQIVVARAGKADDLDDAFATLVNQGARALIIGSDTFFTSQRSQ